MDEFTQKLLTLLDRIETSDESEAHDIARQRFELARQAGYTVAYSFEVTSRMQ